MEIPKYIKIKNVNLEKIASHNFDWIFHLIGGEELFSTNRHDSEVNLTCDEIIIKNILQ